MRVPHGWVVGCVVFLVLVSALLGGCAFGTHAVDQSAGGEFRYVSGTAKGSVIALGNRKTARDLSGKMLEDASTYRLRQDFGNVVVLNFFASWCSPCKVESLQFDLIYRSRKSEHVRFVGIDVKDPNKDMVREFVAAAKLTYPIIYDEPAKTALQLGDLPIGGLPATVIIDKHGGVAAVYTTAVLPNDLNPALDTLTAET
jgi:peroxiredoxin